jgi:glutathione S-transferase
MMFGMIEKRPAFERYWQKLSARPACLRAKELDDSLAASQPSARQ